MGRGKEAWLGSEPLLWKHRKRDAERPVSTRTQRVSCTATVVLPKERRSQPHPRAHLQTLGSAAPFTALGSGVMSSLTGNGRLDDSCPLLRTSEAAHVRRGGFLKAMEDWQACGESWGQDWRGDPKASTGIWGSLSEASGDPKAARREGQAAEQSVVPVRLERRHGG